VSARTIASVVRVAYVMLLARLLGSELYGTYNYALSWYLIFLPLGIFGIDNILVREIGRDRKGSEPMIRQALYLRGVTSMVFALISIAVGWWLNQDLMIRNLLEIVAIALVGRSLSLWAQAIFIAHESHATILKLELTFRVLEVVLGTAAILLGYSVIAVASVHAVCWLAQGILALALVLSRSGRVDARPKFDVMRRLAFLGAPFVLIMFANSWLAQGPIIAFRHYEGIGQSLGQLALGLQAFYILGLIASQMSGPALPVLSRSADRQDQKGDQFISVVLRAGVLMIGVLAIAGLTLSEWVIDLLFGSSYSRTAALLPWTLGLVPLVFLKSTLTSAIVAHGRYWPIFFAQAVGALIFTASVPYLIGTFNDIGAVWAMGLGLITGISIQLAILRSHHHINLTRNLIRAGFAVVAAFTACWLVTPFGNFVALIAGLAALAAIIVAGNVFDETERYSAYMYLRNLVRRH
jgi:O-antigen/teichoic acid export membrane protein